MATAHWGNRTFEVTETTEGVRTQFTIPGAKLGRKEGYCRVCFGDMQAFEGDGYRPLHYHSHKTAKELGLWGATRS